jgi:hypothetical protein
MASVSTMRVTKTNLYRRARMGKTRLQNNTETGLIPFTPKGQSKISITALSMRSS